jgi:hypothetical protein
VTGHAAQPTPRCACHTREEVVDGEAFPTDEWIRIPGTEYFVYLLKR